MSYYTREGGITKNPEHTPSPNSANLSDEMAITHPHLTPCHMLDFTIQVWVDDSHFPLLKLEIIVMK